MKKARAAPIGFLDPNRCVLSCIWMSHVTLFYLHKSLQYWYSGMCTFIEIQFHGNMCLRVYSYTYKQIYTSTCLYFNVFLFMCIRLQIHINLYLCIYIYVYICAFIYTYKHLCFYICLYVYIYTYVYIYVFI